MKFLWPEFLWLLALLPLVVLAYLAALRRRKRSALRYANLALVRQALEGRRAWRRHVPAVLLLLGIAALTVAVARPTAVLKVPSRQETIVLAMDVSGSMRAADVKPDRISAAQAAVRAFVEEVPRGTRLAVVSFAATATVVQPPTHNREDVLAAIERFQLQRGTAVGSGLLVALKTIFPDVRFELRSADPRPRRGAERGAAGKEADKGAGKEAGRPSADASGGTDSQADGGAGSSRAVAPGSYGAATIVLLTDGQSNVGPDPVEAARMAAERGVRVYTVGVGTAKGETISAEGWSMRVRLDEETLKAVANTTLGEYHQAGTAEELRKVYRTLGSRIAFERRQTEVSALFGAAGAALLLIAAGLSLVWFNRVV